MLNIEYLFVSKHGSKEKIITLDFGSLMTPKTVEQYLFWLI